MPIEVIKGEAVVRTDEPRILRADELRNLADLLDAANAELRAKQIEEVFRSDYVTVFRRSDGVEAVVCDDLDDSWRWHMVGPVTVDTLTTREEAELKARESLMDADVRKESK